jgi:hypothetical protein
MVTDGATEGVESISAENFENYAENGKRPNKRSEFLLIAWPQAIPSINDAQGLVSSFMTH